MIHSVGVFLFSLIIIQSLYAHVVCSFRGRLGNQLFQAAAAIALAEEMHCGIYFPDFEKLDQLPDDHEFKQLKENYQHIFWKIPRLREKIVPTFIYNESSFEYHPIPYQGDTEIVGFFVSEKYFQNYKNQILNLFSPSLEIELMLSEKFSEILQHPQSVGVHVRTGFFEYQTNNFDKSFYQKFLAPDLEFLKKAIELFDENALFVVFSDHIDWCKENLPQLNRNFVFIENQYYLHDFYLLSKCKHTIFANSTFSWWAAYLNKNPEKKVICRKPFFIFDLDVACSEWIQIPMENIPPIPNFKGNL